ncbi:MAG: hypothetical protein WC723_05320 [Candidatus Omnitrophota bacterium]
MRKIILLSLFIILSCAGACVIFNKAYSKNTALAQGPKSVSRGVDRAGEKIIYRVQLGKLYLGKAVFKHLPKVKFQDREVNLMTFETRLTRFVDLEKIYSDPKSFLPVRVERDISTWPFPEKITEDYDQEKFTLVIKKLKYGRESESVIKKSSVINNAILLPYYVRDIAKLEVGYNLMVVLPTQEFIIELAAIEEINVPAGRFMAYRFQSRPEKFQIWISADERRIPVKISGTTGLGYSLVMQEYSAG